ncbi:hypothetical protein EJB05_27022, partial [Eragrostis curvula]
MEIGEAATPVSTPRDGKRTWTSPAEPGVAAPLVPRFGGSVLDPRRSDRDDGDEDDVFSDDDDDELYYTDDTESDSDIEFEDDDDDDPQEFGDCESAAGISTDVTVAPVEFLGTKARFASVESTAGFMLLGAFDHGHGGGGEITVHYRYARFTRDESGGGGVELYSGGKLHTVRFLVPSHAFAAASDVASSLRLAGAALADMVHPRGFTAPLQSLWSNLVAAAPVRVPPWAARVEVTVSAGILRCRDRTPERMASMRAALAAEPHVRPSLRDVGVVLHLPAPARRVDEDVRPAKRRRLAGVEEEEECAICYEMLERGLAEWPRCAHVFHGECLERLLVTGDQRCPLCRSELNVPAQRVNAC